MRFLELNNQVDFDVFVQLFQTNDYFYNSLEPNSYHTLTNSLKKVMKEVGIEVDSRDNSCMLPDDLNVDEIRKNLITPENVCQYESCLWGKFLLESVGIMELSSPEKIPYAVNKFVSEERNKKLQRIAKRIEEEMLQTPWNLSDEYIQNTQNQGMMILRGIGDPSRCKGGYSYLKLPLKMSQETHS